MRLFQDGHEERSMRGLIEGAVLMGLWLTACVVFGTFLARSVNPPIEASCPSTAPEYPEHRGGVRDPGTGRRAVVRTDFLG